MIWNEQLDYLCQLKFKEDELLYLRSLRFIKSDFVDYLELFQLKRRFIKASIDSEGRLDIWVEGPMVQAMMFEILSSPLSMNCISAVSVLMKFWQKANAVYRPKWCCWININNNSSRMIPLLVSDFGTRRRYSYDWQKHVIEAFHQAAPDIFRGTSNVLIAKRVGSDPNRHHGTWIPASLPTRCAFTWFSKKPRKHGCKNIVAI